MLTNHIQSLASAVRIKRASGEQRSSISVAQGHDNSVDESGLIKPAEETSSCEIGCVNPKLSCKVPKIGCCGLSKCFSLQDLRKGAKNQSGNRRRRRSSVATNNNGSYAAIASNPTQFLLKNFRNLKESSGFPDGSRASSPSAQNELESDDDDEKVIEICDNIIKQANDCHDYR